MGRILAAALTAVALAQLPPRADPKPSASDYPAHTALSDATLAAEFMVRSIHGSGSTFSAQDYLVFDVAIYPRKATTLRVKHSQFQLRLNGAKVPLLPTPPQFVAAALKYPDWERRPSVIATAGRGDGIIVVGRQPEVGRFPDDRRAEKPLPPPRAPEAPHTQHRGEQPVAEEVAVRESLPEGEFASPVRGYLYFLHKGKTKSLKR
ncbi:MAG: hypothetical protein ACRD44_17110, partial [Bryobacteraceae bacterium]